MTAALPGGAPAPGWSTAWADALAELEMSVAEAEMLLHAAHRSGGVDPVAAAVAASRWTPPSNLGLLPTTLAERARTLLGRQLRVAQGLAEAAAHSRRQLRAVEGLRAEAESGPVYIDTAG